jgi:hypothetical protein
MLIPLGAACSSSATLREATPTRADDETYEFGHVTKRAEITVKKGLFDWLLARAV